MYINRRLALKLSGAAFSAVAFPIPALGKSLDIESQSGDPDAELERIEFNLLKAARPALADRKASFLQNVPNFGDEFVKEARSFIGFNREKNKEAISDMLNAFGLKFEDERGSPYPYCAAGLSYVAARVYAKIRAKDDSYSKTLDCIAEVNHYHFFPNPGVANMRVVNAVNGRWIDYSDSFRSAALRPGWLVAFKWKNAGHHIGLIESVSKENLNTIEFNTSAQNSQGSNRNGGSVASRQRPWNSDIIGFINTSKSVRT